MPKVLLQGGETQEQLLRRFRKEVVKSRVLTDARRKRWFIPNSEVRRIKEKKASRRGGSGGSSSGGSSYDGGGGGGYNR